MSVGMCDGLQLEEFFAEFPHVDVEGSGGGWASMEGFGEEFVVRLGDGV